MYFFFLGRKRCEIGKRIGEIKVEVKEHMRTHTRTHTHPCACLFIITNLKSVSDLNLILLKY